MTESMPSQGLEEREQREGAAGRRTQDGWHIVRGVPVALIVTVAIQTVGLIVGIGLALFNLVAEVRSQGKQITQVEIKVDALSSIVNSATAPAAVNAARISGLESRVQQLGERQDVIREELARLRGGLGRASP